MEPPPSAVCLGYSSSAVLPWSRSAGYVVGGSLSGVVVGGGSPDSSDYRSGAVRQAGVGAGLVFLWGVGVLPFLFILPNTDPTGSWCQLGFRLFLLHVPFLWCGTPLTRVLGSRLKVYNTTPLADKYVRVRSREHGTLCNPYLKSRKLMVAEGGYKPSEGPSEYLG